MPTLVLCALGHLFPFVNPNCQSDHFLKYEIYFRLKKITHKNCTFEFQARVKFNWSYKPSKHGFIWNCQHNPKFSNANDTAIIKEIRKLSICCLRTWAHWKWFMSKLTKHLNAFSSDSIFFNATSALVHDSAFHDSTAPDNISLFW